MDTRNARDHDIITIKNIDDEDFRFEFDKVSGNPPYIIKAGEVRRFPRYLARHAVKHLIDKILIKQKTKINNMVARDNIASQIVVDEEVFAQENTISETEKLQKEIEKLNQPSDLELVLARSKAAEKDRQPVVQQVVQKPAIEEKKEEKKEEKFEQVEQEKDMLKELVVDEPKPTEELEVDKPKENNGISLPTKDDLKTFATAEMGMTWDDKLKESFEKLSVKQIMKELQYPLERLIQ